MGYQLFDISAKHTAEDLADLLIRSDDPSEYVLWECDDRVAHEGDRRLIRLRRYPSGWSLNLVFTCDELGFVRFSDVTEEDVYGLPLPVVASLILDYSRFETDRN